MNIIERYLARHVMLSTALAYLVLVALITFFWFIDELDNVGKGRYGVVEALEYVLLITPRLAYQLLPMGVLLGAIIGLGMLAGSSELTAIRAAGISLARIAGTLLKIGVLFIVIAVLLGEWIGPHGERLAQTHRSVAMSESLTLQGKEGLWARDGNTFINVRELLPGERLGEIILYEVDESRRLTRLSRARSAVYRDNQWLLQNVDISDISRERVQSIHHDTLAWPTSLSPELLKVVTVRPETLSAPELYQYVQYLKDNGLRAEPYQQALWAKLANLGVTLLMLLLAIPFVFGPLRSVSIGYRILTGTLLGIAFHLINQTIGFMGLVYNLPPLLSAFLPALLLLTTVIVLLRRVR